MAPVAFRFRREHSCWLLVPPDLVSNLTASIGLTLDQSLVRIEQIQEKNHCPPSLSLENLIRSMLDRLARQEHDKAAMDVEPCQGCFGSVQCLPYRRLGRKVASSTHAMVSPS
jgi:hypothetical protein